MCFAINRWLEAGATGVCQSRPTSTGVWWHQMWTRPLVYWPCELRAMLQYFKASKDFAVKYYFGWSLLVCIEVARDQTAYTVEPPNTGQVQNVLELYIWKTIFGASTCVLYREVYYTVSLFRRVHCNLLLNSWFLQIFSTLWICYTLHLYMYFLPCIFVMISHTDQPRLWYTSRVLSHQPDRDR